MIKTNVYCCIQIDPEPAKEKPTKAVEPAKSQIIAPGKKRENDITPQVIEREKTVIHPSNKTNTTYPTVKPVFD